MIVHFIWLGGDWLPQHDRALRTAARAHGSTPNLWARADAKPPAVGEAHNLRQFEFPRWLRNHPIRLANVKDLFAWRILRDHGGLYLDLDTISLKPVDDLLTRHVLVSLEHDRRYKDDHPYNSAVVAGVQGATILHELADRALKILEAGVNQWGACGPRLLTDVVGQHRAEFDVAPFGVLNGWRDGTIHRYYEGRRPGRHVRVVHLFSSSNMDAFTADRWEPRL